MIRTALGAAARWRSSLAAIGAVWAGVFAGGCSDSRDPLSAPAAPLDPPEVVITRDDRPGRAPPPATAEASGPVEWISRVEALVATYERIHEEAEDQETERVAPSAWRSADRRYRRALTLLTIGGVGTGKKAHAEISRAIDDLEQALAAAREVRERRDELRDRVRASQAELADRLAVAESQRIETSLARELEAEADRAVRAADLRSALYFLKAARTELEDRSDEIRPPGTELAVAAAPAPPPRAEARFAGLERLFSVTPVLETDACVRLHYAASDFIANDLQLLRGPTNCVFQTELASPPESPFLFTGCENGALLFDAVYQDRVTIECTVRFHWVRPEAPRFLLLAMADRGDFYATNLGTDLRMHGGPDRAIRIPSDVRDYNRKNPTRWLSTRRPLRLRLTYERTPEAGILQASLDGRERCRFRTDALLRGQVGLSWNNVKFTVQDLTITGQLCDDWVQSSVATTRPRPQPSPSSPGARKPRILPTLAGPRSNPSLSGPAG